MPQLDPSTYPTQLFWLIVTFALLYVVLWRVVLPRIGDVRTSRQTRIGADLDRAEELKREAEAVRAAFEKTLAGATAEAQAIHRETAQNLAAQRAEKMGALATELAGEAAAAERRIAAGKQTALGEIGDVATGLVQAAVERLIGARVDTTEAEAAVKSLDRAA